jgi:lysophospholipase L1-like esterase
MVLRVLVFGDSFVRRLQDYLHSEFVYNLDIDAEKVCVEFYGFGGLTISRAEQYRTEITNRRPDVIILLLGANDLDKRDNIYHRDIRLIAADVVDFANQLLHITRRVYVFPAYHRLTPRLSAYEDFLPRFNETIDRICKNLYGIKFCALKNLTRDWPQYLLTDGIHLTHEGNRKYCIRGAVLNACKHFDQ